MKTPFSTHTSSLPPFSVWRALWLSIWAHLSESFRRASMMAMVPVAMSLMFFSLSMFLMHQIHVRYNTSQPVVSGGGQFVVRMIERAGNKEQHRLEGVRFFVDGPEKRSIETLLQRQGGVVVLDERKANLVLRYEAQKHVWRMEAQDKPLLILLWNDVRNIMQESQQRVKVVVPPQDERAKVEKISRYLHIFLGWAILTPLVLFVWGSSASMAQDVNRARNEGALEALALGRVPFWVYLLGQSMGRALYVGLFSSGLIALAGWFVVFPHPLTWAATIVSLMVLSTVMNLWGALQVVWFHHRYSHALGAVLLNPVLSPIPFLLLILMQGENVMRLMQHPSLTDPVLPILHTSPTLALSMMVVHLVVGGLMVVGLAWLIEKRLGPRRTGLAKI